MPATKGVTEQDVLKVFDAADAPFLTAQEVAAELDISAEGARYHLQKMHDEDLLGRKDAGSTTVGWWAEVAPRLAPEVATEVGDRREHDSFVPLEDV